MSDRDAPQNTTRVVFTKHALEVMAERQIPTEWVDRTVTEPAIRTEDPNDTEVERFYCAIPESDDRVLRVAVNTSASPWRVVSVFLDRRMRGQL